VTEWTSKIIIASQMASRPFIRTQISVSPQDTLFSQDADRFELGYVDSVGVEVSEVYLLSDDFSTIKRISRVVQELI
jgi:hypothetical protein